MESSTRPPSAPWRAAREFPHPVHDPPRVLVADDDAEMRRVVVDALRRDGYAIREVGDGRGLFAVLTRDVLCDSGTVDLIVSDIRMPAYNGLEIIEALREVHAETPVILMTGFGDAATRARAESLGAVLLDKPFDVDDLRTAVANLLERHP